MQTHPIADIFPLLDGDEFTELAEDIRQHGQRHPIITWQGKILDGRNRYNACREAEVTPKIEGRHFADDSEAILFVISANLKRRHLTPSAKAMAAARSLEMFEAAARERHRAGSSKGGKAVANLPGPSEERRARDDAAAAFGASPRNVQDAKKVLTSGSTELAQAVDKGNASVANAAAVATLPTTEQQQVVAKGEKEILAEAKRIREQRREAAAKARHQRQQDAAKKAAEAAPDIEGIEIRHCDCAAILADTAAAVLIHADPPWNYGNQIKEHGAVGAHYGDLSIADIASTINDAYAAAADNCYLLLWCTLPILAEWFEAARDIRWAYKSAGVWGKTGRLGVGFHWRGDAEILMLYVKGNPRPFREDTSNLHVGPRGEHSEKPQAWLETLLETFCPPSGLVLDLYAGMAPAARACAKTGRRYLGAEIDAQRHATAVAKLRSA